MTLRLHWSPDSANLVVRLALEELGLAYDGVRLDRATGEQGSAAYRRLNPQGLIPVLEDGDLVLFETGAILWHLAERTGRLGPDGPLLSDDRARTRALSWLFYLSNTVHADLRVAFYTNRWIGPEGIAPLRAGIAARMAQHLDLIETQASGGFLGPAVCLPDLYLAVMLRWMQLYPGAAPILDSLDRWPGMAGRAAMIERRPAVRRAMEAEAILADHALTMPRLPDLPRDQVTG